MRTGFLSPKLEVRMTPEKGGFAVFACQSVAKDELLAMWGGRVSLLEDVLALPREQQGHTIQIYDNLYLTPETMDEPADYVNHSCDPNCGLWGQVGLVAMRAIAPGEEITFDYAMADSSSFDEFECACGTPSCRGRVAGSDWTRRELWARYDGYFSAYLQRKIDQMRGRVE